MRNPHRLTDTAHREEPDDKLRYNSPDHDGPRLREQFLTPLRRATMSPALVDRHCEV